MPGMLQKSSLLAAGAALLLSTAAYADTIVLRGARVLTMDDAKPEAKAIALVDGKIAAVGSDADVEPFLKGAKVYDLPADALVLPGFQDSHNHLIWSAAQAEDISLTDVADEAGLRAAIEPAHGGAAQGCLAARRRLERRGLQGAERRRCSTRSPATGRPISRMWTAIPAGRIRRR